MSWYHHYLFFGVPSDCVDFNFEKTSSSECIKVIEDILYLTSRSDYLGQGLEELFNAFNKDFDLDFLTHRYGCFKSWKTDDSKKVFDRTAQQQFIQNINELFACVLASDTNLANELKGILPSLANYSDTEENDNAYAFAFYLSLDLMKRKVQQDIDKNLSTVFFTYCE